jgi:hypothetical protein
VRARAAPVEWLCVSAAAARVGVKSSDIRSWARHGHLTVRQRPGDFLRILASSLPPPPTRARCVTPPPLRYVRTVDPDLERVAILRCRLAGVVK